MTVSRVASSLAYNAAHSEGAAMRTTGAWTVAIGLTAGALDLVYAMSVWWPRGVAPAQVLQSVASGVLGRAAFTGGMASAALGLLLHLLIAVAMAAAFFVAARRWPWLTAHPWLGGALYGLALHVLMNHVVVPLSAAPLGVPRGIDWLIALVPHVLCVGWPIAWAARRVAQP